MAEQEREDRSKAFDKLTGTQKSAILMMLLGEDEASEILKNFSPKEVQHIGSAMYSVEGLDQDTVNKVLDEFLAIIKEQTSLGLGAGDYIQNVLNKALGQDRAQSILGRITPSESSNAIEILEWMDSRAIAELISDEHPQIISLIISYLEPTQASDVLVMLDEKIQPEIIKRIATIQTVQPEALKNLELVMQKKFAANTSLRASQVGGVKAAASILNFMIGDDEQKLFKEIAKFSKNLMTDIQEAMFVFDNLIKSDDKSMQVIIRSVETEDLVLAMKGADEELKEKMMNCMSQRAAANISDEMDALGPVRLSEVQEAQKRIINTARRLSDEGSIVLAGRGGDDYV